MEQSSGFWLPHSSSVDFCEKDYLISPYIVEFHNSWSSIAGIALLPALALIFSSYSNPTKEWRFTVMNLILITVGIGSFMLHSTLKALAQSSDEVPMLYMNIAFLYALLEGKSPIGKPRYPQLPLVLVAIAILQTIIYYTYQRYYAAFLFSYISMVTIVVLWTGRMALYDADPLSNRLWKAAIANYILIGTPLWIVEMNMCDALLPFFNAWFGLSFHILWHFGAGVGTYLTILFLTSMRVKAVYGEDPTLGFICGICPVIKRGERMETKTQ
jgi:dihydroceramidase